MNVIVRVFMREGERGREREKYYSTQPLHCITVCRKIVF